MEANIPLTLNIAVAGACIRPVLLQIVEQVDLSEQAVAKKGELSEFQNI